MPTTIDPTSRAGRLLALLRSTPNEAWSIEALASAAGLTTQAAAQALYGGIRGAGKGSAWRRVDRPSRGTWVYRDPEPDPVMDPAGWQEVATEPGVAVLRAPDGALWIARPMSA